MAGDGRAIILFLEDDEDSRLYIKQSLREGGYRVISADDEEEAVELINFFKFTPDVILVDLGVRPEEALAVGRSVRERGGLDGELPVIVITEAGGPETQETDVKVDGTDYIYTWDEDGQLIGLLERLTSKGGL